MARTIALLSRWSRTTARCQGGVWRWVPVTDRIPDPHRCVLTAAVGPLAAGSFSNRVRTLGALEASAVDRSGQMARLAWLYELGLAREINN